MTNTKHDKGKRPFADDLEHDPGIGQSKGTFMTGVSPDENMGENTLEGDTENDSTATDGVPQEDRQRTNA